MSQVTRRPTICLNMIVRNEAHIVHEVLTASAPYISSWVIVDTGSTDGTPVVVKEHMAKLGIPGELHERPWVDFGHNRTEALALAQGHADYIWVMDADDTIDGTIDFSGLDADVYLIHLLEKSTNVGWWRAQVFRDGLPVRYEGVIHEHPVYAPAAAVGRLGGDYRISARLLGGRNRTRDRELLLAAIERNPQDAHSVFQLALDYFAGSDFADAGRYFARRAEMGGADAEEIYLALFHIAAVKMKIGAPWPETRSALLDAWEYRPSRAEPVYYLAANYRTNERYLAGYHLAGLAAEIPRPEKDVNLVFEEIYGWLALEEQLVCAAALGNHAEAFRLSQRLLARPTVPDEHRRRIAANRDKLAQSMIEAAMQYPEALVHRQSNTRGEPSVLVSLVAGPDREYTEGTLNSLLNCCTDLPRAGRIVAVGSGLSDTDRAGLQQRYGFLEFADTEPLADTARYHLRLVEGWRLFAPDNLITRLTAVLATEPTVAQVGVNCTDAPDHAVRWTPGTGHYVLTAHPPQGPAMIDTTRIGQPGMGAASLDEVVAVATPKPSRYITL